MTLTRLNWIVLIAMATIAVVVWNVPALCASISGIVAWMRVEQLEREGGL